MSARFGPAGNSESFSRVYKSSLSAPGWIADLGLDCYEYQCGKGVRVKKETAVQLGERARAAGIAVSLHAPYFINLANPESIQRNNGYVLVSCALAEWMGAGRVVVHTGALMGRARREALEIAKRGMKALLAVVDTAGLGHIALCPETMGKINQLGDLDEVLELCTLDERLVPCIDFGHLYARSLGADDGQEVFCRMLDRVEEMLGADRASTFHSHFSHIEFTLNGGEKCHRTFDDDGGYGPHWAPLAAEIARRGWSPTFICESAGTQAEDALSMKRVYEGFL
ncbi:MAG: TIM barrel protein [Lawsonibacter sp.]|nr:TIM barrel protein [Lawsonibacter sp.]